MASAGEALAACGAGVEREREREAVRGAGREAEGAAARERVTVMAALDTTAASGFRGRAFPDREAPDFRPSLRQHLRADLAARVG